MVVRMRHTKSHRNNRRAHHALEKPAVAVDKDTGTKHLRHRVNPTTGKYRGRQVLEAKV